MAHYTLHVEGMTCGGCVRSVRTMISKTLSLDAEAVEVDLEGKHAAFDVADDTDLAPLLAKLEKRGFPSKLKG